MVGPVWVIVPGDKTFHIMVGGREEIISTDRWKPAHVDLTGPVPVAQSPRRGRPPLEPAEPATQERPPQLESSLSHHHFRSTRSPALWPSGKDIRSEIGRCVVRSPAESNQGL
ncbi:Pol polyprotein [Elysia marginata]|uniref:Pol polyprotein n=1 Tax=Elysia marginata TaxID=1093978 RepID=A0AAV4JDH4_9GAST|nr:Pol polyprotein [Elysia marginata]